MSNEQLAKMFSTDLPGNNGNHYAEIIKDHPYCSIAQFYFLQGLQKNHSPDFQQQAKKTALYFSNITWLNWQLLLHTRPDKTKNYTEKEILPEHVIETPLEIESLESDNSTDYVKRGEFTKLSIQENNTTEEIVAFEPLHTVDYFASQGIKITYEQLANDKLGKQMKSFTEWLKSMKKVHAQTLPEDSEQANNKIQHIAEDSNVQSDVLTEAMAQVLVKQNKLDKAIEMYEKLSLINPSKSAYFATKIESLKSV